jgi:SOUL heme-binding protein
VQRDQYEIREYESYIVAEVEMEGNMKQALYGGFRQLAGYIFGGNTSRTTLGVSSTMMETVKAPENIAMTVPVMDTSSSSGKHIIAFTMPSKYRLDTLPKPSNANIRFRKVEKSRRAVLRYTWYATTARVEAKKKILKDRLNRDGYVIKGEFISAQYNPPMSFPLLRRNEIMVDIE